MFDKVRERWRGRIELQAVALVGPDIMLDKAAYRAVAERAQASGGRLGGAIAIWPEARQAVFNAVELAGELGMDLDLHIDETLEVESGALRHLADAVIETGFAGRVLAGHCCVLSAQEDAISAATVARVAEAGIAVVSLPMVQPLSAAPTQARRPRRRPLSRRDAGARAERGGRQGRLRSDNTRDPFYAYGDLDGLEVFREGARIAHIDHPQGGAWNWLGAVTRPPPASPASTIAPGSRPARRPT